LSSAWAFAVAAWARPRVEAACLDLQDLHGQSPALLLWRWRTLVEHRGVTADALATAVQLASGWEVEVLGPLRALRRRLATRHDSVPDGVRAAVRRRVLDAELEAERGLLDALEALETPCLGELPRPQALIDLAEAWRPPAPSAALLRLIEAL